MPKKLVIDEANLEHSIISASNAGRVKACPASAYYNALYQDFNSSTKYSSEGTRAHSYGEQALKTGVHAADLVPANEPPDMVGKVQAYLDYIRQFTYDMSFVEMPLDLSKFIPKGKGTADFIGIAGDNLHVIDYKNGAGVKVYADNNTQLLCYAIGALFAIPADVRARIKTITMTIAQPAFEICSAVISIDDLLQFAFLELQPAMNLGYHLFENPDEIKECHFNPSKSTCQFCGAKSRCKALAKESIKVFGEDFLSSLTNSTEEPNMPDLNVMSNDELAAAYKNSYLLKSFLTTLEEKCLSLLRDRKKLTGFKLVAGNVKKSWSDIEAVKKAFRAMKIPKTECFKETIITPAQAIKLIKQKDKGARYGKKILDLINEESNTVKIASESSSKEEYILPEVPIVEEQD